MNINKLIILLFLLFYPENLFSKQFNKNEVLLSNKILDFLKNLNTIQGNFVQFSEINQGMAEGRFYIKKPKKIRFEYVNPNKILIVSSGDIVNYYDRDLDEITIIPAQKTPLPFLFDNNFGVNSDKSNIIGIDTKSENNIKIFLKINFDNSDYFVEYTFDKNITKILEISVYDESEQKTILSLSNVLINHDINDSIFVFKNPRLYKNRK